MEICNPKISAALDRTARTWLARLLIAHFIWRFVCFLWLPLNLQGLPGAFFESSALASSGLLAIWLVHGEGKWWWRGIVAGALFLALRAAQDLGIASHAWRTSSEFGMEFVLLWFAEGEVVAICLVLALFLRILTGRRLKRRPPGEVEMRTPYQLPLLNLFLLTGLVAILAGVFRADWFATLFRNDYYNVQRILFFHSLGISLAIFSALVILQVGPRWWTLFGVVIVWFVLAALIALGLHLADWFEWHNDLVVHLITIFSGAGLAAAGTAIVVRRMGYRLQRVAFAK